MTGNSQNFARIKLGIKLISDSVKRNENSGYIDDFVPRKVIFKCLLGTYLKILRPHKGYSKIPIY